MRKTDKQKEDKMIKKLRIKFIAVIMVMLTIVMVVIFASLNFVMIKTGRAQSFDKLRMLADNDGQIRPAPNDIPPDSNLKKAAVKGPEVPDSGQYSVKLNQDGDIFEVISDFPDSITESEVSELVKAVLATGKQSGQIDGQLFLVRNKDYGKIIAFSDGRMENTFLSRLLNTSMSVCALSLIFLFFIALYLSKWVVKPVETAFEKQRQFVADASHELKTPLTVIGANADVLQSEIGDNKWLSYIKSETARMSKLVNDLLYLTKYDTKDNIYNYQKFNLSNAVTSAMLPFESIIFELGKTLKTKISPDLFITGDEDKIKQLVIILLDNAVKNSFDKGEIELKLTSNDSKIHLSVKNTGEGIDEKDLPLIFERFYRCDSSRNRSTGGFGLGLSIAKSIVEGHGGKISVVSKMRQYTEFTVAL